MKRTTLLNRHLSTLIASLGHMDEIVIADAGLPVPNGVSVIDLALCPGVPGFFQVLNALKSELVIEGAIWAEEASVDLNRVLEEVLDQWSAETDQEITRQRLSHEAFKQQTKSAKAVIRSGETTPYANIILISGVAF